MVQYLAIAFTLVSALGIAAYSLFIRIGTSKSDGTVNDALVVILLSNFVIVAPATVFLHHSVTVTPVGIAAFVGAGLVATILGRISYYKGIELAGSSRTEPLKATQLVYATVIPVIVLGEVLSVLQVAGILAIILGVVAISLESQSENVSSLASAKTGILFGLASGLFYGLEPTLAKIGIAENVPILVGITIKTVTALVLFVTYLRLSGWSFTARSSSSWFFIAAGAANTVFLVSYYAALERAPVTIVYPILQTSPLFIIGLSLLFVPSNLERITWKLVLGSVIIVAGTVIVIIA
ncbi:DMT family transporter [Halobellus rufus]|uniref:DMT family transporter n=1 Tax=Halobellus rufus TaxID=1448860 RepID=UPI000678D3BE|nr:EamA family transporter [Halobellus rufus]